jgi:hypothetical protein
VFEIPFELVKFCKLKGQERKKKKMEKNKEEEGKLKETKQYFTPKILIAEFFCSLRKRSDINP